MAIEQANTAAPTRDLVLEVARYWWREWVALAREIRARIIPGELPLPLVTFMRSDILIANAGAPNPLRIARDDELTGSSISALRREIPSHSSVVLIFPEEAVLRPVLRLPKAPLRVLRKAIYFELVRLSPVHPDQLYFDLGTQSLGANELGMKVRVIRRAIVDSAVAQCHAAGLSVASIRVGDDAHPADWKVFPVDRQAFLLAEARRLKLLALGGLVLLLAAFLLAASYARGNASLAEIALRLEVQRTRATAVEHLRGQIESLTRAESFVAVQKQRPLVAGTVAELSRVLPDDTWITDLQIDGRKVRVQGYSKSASHLIARIDSSDRFSSAQFQAPLTQDSATGTSRFDLSFQVSK